MTRSSQRLWLLEGFLEGHRCAQILQAIEAYRQKVPLPEIYRPAPERSLRYSVINGRQIAESFPDFHRLGQEIQVLAEEKSGLSLQAMKDDLVGININITKPGGEYRWHYDRNALTAILFLNEVEGGETEIYPGYRLQLKRRKHSSLQRKLDNLLMKRWLRRCFGKKATFAPRAGNLLLMRGDECLHSVRPVVGNRDRINALFSYEIPGALHPHAEGLDEYLYTERPGFGRDPNYLG